MDLLMCFDRFWDGEMYKRRHLFFYTFSLSFAVLMGARADLPFNSSLANALAREHCFHVERGNGQEALWLV